MEKKYFWIVWPMFVGFFKQTKAVIDISKPYGYGLTNDEERLKHKWRCEAADRRIFVTNYKLKYLDEHEIFDREIASEKQILQKKEASLKNEQLGCKQLETDLQRIAQEAERVSQKFSLL